MLVTCICPTMKSRYGWLPTAVRSFLEQTYPDKELLFVADGDWITEFMPPGDERFRYVHYDHLNIGTRRNVACENARGQVICHWDDDDFSLPGRIADQVNRLLLTNSAVTGYSSLPFFDGEKWWRYKGNHTMVIGSSLCYSREFWSEHKFAAEQVGEDSSFVGAAIRARQLAPSGGLGLMHCSMHLGNSSPRRIEPNTWDAMPEWAGVEFGKEKEPV